MRRVRILLQTKMFVAEDWIQLRDEDPLPATAYFTVPKMLGNTNALQVIRFTLRDTEPDPYYVQVAP